jgi:hypothetical protein
MGHKPTYAPRTAMSAVLQNSNRESGRPRLLYPPKADMMSAKGQSGHRPSLFDHLVGACKHGLRHGETEGFRRLEIDRQGEFRRCLDRQIRGFLAF